jgi:hypothetical protein
MPLALLLLTHNSCCMQIESSAIKHVGGSQLQIFDAQYLAISLSLCLNTSREAYYLLLIKNLEHRHAEKTLLVGCVNLCARNKNIESISRRVSALYMRADER